MSPVYFRIINGLQNEPNLDHDVDPSCSLAHRLCLPGHPPESPAPSSPPALAFSAARNTPFSFFSLVFDPSPHLGHNIGFSPALVVLFALAPSFPLP